MPRLAIYAHYRPAPQVAGHVLHCLRHLAELGFQLCFVSNSQLSPASEALLKEFCERIIVRENTGLDFCMWQRGLAEYDLRPFEELLLINSSIIGPVQPLAPLWQNPALADCDFWGLTDNDEFTPHLSSYFLLFRQPVLRSARFLDFWRAVLPYQDKYQVIFGYELGLTKWLQESGFRWGAAFPQGPIVAAYRSHRGWFAKYRDQLQLLKYLRHARRFPPQNTTLLYPDLLLECGMPFIKASLLEQKSSRMNPAAAFALLEKYRLPAPVLDELRRDFPFNP